MKRKQEDFHGITGNEAEDQLQEIRGVAISLQPPTSPRTDKFNTQANPHNFSLFNRGNLYGQNFAHHLQRSGLEQNSQFSNQHLHDHFQKQQIYDYIQNHGGGLIPTSNLKEALSHRNANNFATVGEIVNLIPKREISFNQYVSQTLASTIEHETTSQSLNGKSKSRSSTQRQAKSLQPKNVTSANTTNQSSDVVGPGNSVQVIQDLYQRENRSLVHSSTPRRKKRKGNTLIDILQPNEIQALGMVNPLHQAFNSHLQKVIQSVQQRKKVGPEFIDTSLNLVNQENSINHPLNQFQPNKSEADAQSDQNRLSISFVDQKARNSEMVPYLVQTPARVRQQAREELEALRDLEKGGRPVALIKPQISDKFVKQPRVVDQVANLLSRVKKDKKKVFIPLEHEENQDQSGGLVFKDAKNQDEVVNGGIVFSQGGFISLAKNKNQVSEFVSKEKYIQEGVETMVLNQVPFFRKFLALKTFKLWKSTMQRNLFVRNRQKLADNFIFSNPIFVNHYADLTVNQNKIRFLQFIENKPGQVYGKHQQYLFADACKAVQQNSKAQLEQLCSNIRQSLEEIRSEIIHDDQQFEIACKESVVQHMIKQRPGHENLILFSQAKAEKEEENQQRQLMQLRHTKFNQLLQLVSRIMFQNISEALISNKVKFTNLFCAQKTKTQYEISVCLDSNGKLDLDPKPDDHKLIFSNVFQMMEASIIKNFFLMAYFQDLTQLYFWYDKATNPPGAMLMRRQVLDIEALIQKNSIYNFQDQLINDQLNSDLTKLDKQLLNYRQIEEIYEFVYDWNQKREKIGRQASSGAGDISQEIEFYKITWSKLHNLDQIIETIPSTFTKIGTIAMETATIKKMLSEMPKKIVEQIRLNVTSTIENETRALKDELCTTSDTLDKLPLTLNIYVDQVNTLKYLKQKKSDFQNKFSTINTLQQQCKIDGIKISLNLQMNIEEVSGLYAALPKLIEKAEQGLQTNKSAIEQNMFKSAQSLSLKIKAFEKKYVENYLQDKNRLDHCKDTLEELLRRQAAIQDIKAKVVLYKEFLRILYEDDIDAKDKLETKKLSCVQDCETIEMIHKNTLKMWKVFLYWAKKRHLCFSAPFLDLDLSKIAKAISKVNKFLAGQSKECEIVAYKSQPITRVIGVQVKETSVIVDFAKDLHKETLQRRHWIQIFSLIKAHHLKNSLTFTIIDLREYSIQNHAEEVKAIIDHANTEAKYENVFNSIQREWEESNLKIIPFKEQMNDYILANGDLMSEAIEENIQTLETISKQPYASHVSQDLTELIVKLKQMLEHLLLWLECQKYWITLDPIYNSGLFKNFFDQHTQDFLDSRSKFRRIMWSSNRHPKTTFNLLIRDRQIVFQKLIHYYAMLQKQVNQFLEIKRLVFTRFYFLTDSQFLDLVMLVNSNQDFSVYINLLFQGAQKLYVTRLLQNEVEDGGQSLAQQLELEQMRDNQEDAVESFEQKLEHFIKKGRSGKSIDPSSESTPIIAEANDEDFSNSYCTEGSNNGQVDTLNQQLIKPMDQSSQFNFKILDNVLAKPLQAESKAKKEKFEIIEDLQSEKSLSDNFSQKDSVSSRRNSISDSKASEAGLKLQDGTYDLNDFDFVQQLSQQVRKQENSPAKKKDVIKVKNHDFIVLGLISQNKELFLFDRHVLMSQPIESWLKQTEQAMQISLQKQFLNSLQRFTEEPLEEWILDYPQQISISAIHLILSQEITEILSSSEPDTSTSQNTQPAQNKTPDPADGTVEGAPEALNSQNQKQFEEIAMKVGGGGQQKVQSEQKTAGDQPNLNNQGRPVKKDPKDAKSAVNVVVKRRATFEPELDIDEQQLQFLEECFGEQSNVENQLEEAIQIMKKDETRMMMAMIAKKNQMIIRRPDYKETVLNVIQHKGLHSLFLRLQYWINKLMKLLYTPKQRLQEKRARVLELPDIQKMVVKSIILFLKHQQEHVESMIKLKIQKVYDFEWMSKMKLVWSEDNNAQAACGGWTQSLGFEYLGTSQRLLLTPLTDRYFVFISSAMRERQSAMIDCNLFDNNAEGVVRELSALCFMPFKVIKCSKTSNLSILTQFLNGCAMANTWMLFEHIDNLNLQTLQVLVKEIQLLHEQFIVSNFTQNLLKRQSEKNENLVSFKHQSFGVFGSSSYRLQQNKGNKADLFRDQIRSAFRCISLSRPNLESALKQILFTENYVEYNSTSALMKTYFEKLYDLKTQELQKTSGKNLFDYEAVEIQNFRQCLKLAGLIKNQNFNAYYQKQLERYQSETEQKLRNEERREVFVQLDEDTGIWVVKKKRKAQYQQERHRLNFQNQMIQAQKYVFEVDALREATRIFFTQKFLGEFRQAAYQTLKNISGNQMRDNTVNLKASEQLLSKIITSAFDSVVESRKHLQTQQEIQMKKIQREGSLEDDAYRGKSKEEAELVKASRLANARVRRALTRKDSLLNYKPQDNYESQTGEGNQSTSKRRLRHHSSINLLETTSRQLIEEKFNIELQNALQDVALELHIDLTDDQLYNCVGVVEFMKRFKGIAIVGPICSGKTQLVKLVTLALQQSFNTVLKNSYVNLNTFSPDELYGPTLAFDQSSLLSLDQPLQQKSIFQLILNNYAQEKMLLSKMQRDRQIWSIYMDQSNLSKDVTDCFIEYLQSTNIREREYLREQEFLLNFRQNVSSLQQSLVENVAVRFPNGNVTIFPSDMYLFFECQSLKDASPSFITQVGILNTQAEDVTAENIFTQLLTQTAAKHNERLFKHQVNFFHIQDCCRDFLHPFVANLNKIPQFNQYPLWNLKALATQFFAQLNSELFKLYEACEKYKNVEDKMVYPIIEMERDVLKNAVLQAAVWSYGAVLNSELRKQFDDQLGVYKQNFNINFAVPSKTRYRIFEIFFDFDRLVWQPIVEKLEYKLKSYYEQNLQALLLPSLELSQAFYMIDNQVAYMRYDKELNKQFRLIGPSSSSKTVILNTFASKVAASVKCISVPMSAYLTFDLFKETVEQNYKQKRQNKLVPRDKDIQILLVIDDVHMHRNLNVDLLEFLRSWCFCRGYFSAKQGFFKKVADFGCIMAENINFVATTNKSERFLFYSTTLFCDEIKIDSFKHYVQNWLTTGQWPVSTLISKYYLLISNSILTLLEKMKKAENVVDNFTFTSLTSFHFLVKFCSNLVSNTSFIDKKQDVFGLGYESQRKEEEAVADLFCYEVMRTYGDRLMRPATRIMLMEKLANIVQKEFLCPETYNAAYIEQLVLGDYHIKEPHAQLKYISITEAQKSEVIAEIKKKSKKYSGNQFLPLLLDTPTGLQDLYKVCRILYKPQQHLMLIGQAGVSKMETIQLAAILGQAALFEVDIPIYGQPLEFAYKFRQIMLSVAKFNANCYIVLNDQLVKDPVYYDFVFNFMSQLSRTENFVVFDRQFFIDLCAIEAQHIKKLAKVTVPPEDILFRQAVRRLQKNAHIVFVMSDLISYKEIITLYPQLEYMCEVVYFEDLTQQDYLDTAVTYLAHSNLPEEILGEDQQLAKSFVEVRNRVKQFMLKSNYTQSMLRFTVREEGLVHGAAEFVFNNIEKLTGKVYSASQGFHIKSEDLQQVLLNIPLDISVMNKHKYCVLLELFRHLFELISMHLSIRKSYYETFLAKSRQFTKYFASVKDSKKRLYEDQSNHSFRVSMAIDKIKEIKAQIQEKNTSIQKKSQEIEELKDELNIAEQEVEVIINEKTMKLERIVEEIENVDQADCLNLMTQINNLSDIDQQLLRCLQIFIQMQSEPKFNKTDAVSQFLQRQELIDILNDRRARTYSKAIFEKLQEFIHSRSHLEYTHNTMLACVYTYLLELYRKLNIKNTMAATFMRIREIRTQIDSCNFSINYAKQSIEVKNDDLRIQNIKLSELQQAGQKLSKKVEEAEISHMRTDQIYDNIQDYSRRIQSKLTCITSRSASLLGDTILLATSVVYLGSFSPEERENIRAQIYEYLTKVRNIPCNKMWIDMPQTFSANPNKSMFLRVLKDLGLRDILTKKNLPGVLSNHQFCEALFSILFAPSCPVVCDPTGVIQKFVQEKLFADMDVQQVSGADITANEKLAQCLANGRPSIVLDTNNQASVRAGLSGCHQILSRLAQSLYNGVDFDGKRLAQVKKIKTIGSFISHQTGLNRRIPILSAALEHISLYQAQIFQNTFEFQLNQDYLQNCTLVCAAPSLIVEARNKLDDNNAVTYLKELLLSHLLPQSYAFNEIKQKLENLNRRILQLEKNYENAFLIASGETLKNFQEYSVLRSSVEDIINAREEKSNLVFKYKLALKQVKLVNEASDVIYQMYLSLKLTGKMMQQGTYCWQTYLSVVDGVLQKMIKSIKLKTIQKNRPSNTGNNEEPENPDLSEVEVEIDNSFFKKMLIPQIHKTMMSSLPQEMTSIFNLLLSLRLAQTYKAISGNEHQFILKQLVELKEFKKWRSSDHEFVKLNEVVDKMRHVNLRRELLRLYPEVARQVFDQVEKHLGQSFQYMDASLFIQKDLKVKYQLSQVQLLTFGFMCPDQEFKSKLALFMYTQNLATFDFSEEPETLFDFIQSADWHTPIALLSQHALNPINLVTSLAQQQGRSLLVLRSDLQFEAAKLQGQLFNQKITETINNQLADFSRVKLTHSSQVNQVEFEGQLNLLIDEDEPLAKHNWLVVKGKEKSLDEGKIFYADGEELKINTHVNRIVEAANSGSWVLVCPLSFPQYRQKLFEKLDHMRSAGQINKNFRLLIDLQNFSHNEIPDSFLHKECLKFYLTAENYDKTISFNDIWSKILDPQYLNILTDTENGNTVLKKIEAQSDEFSQPTVQFMQVFAKEQSDLHTFQLFNKFIESSAKEYEQKLETQRAEMLQLMMEEKKRIEAENERQQQQSQQRSESNSNVNTSFINMKDNIGEEKQVSSLLSLPRTNSTQQMQELAGMIASINEYSQQRLTVVASEGDLNLDTKQNYSRSQNDTVNLNSNFQKRDQSVPISGMESIPVASNQQSQDEETK